MKIDRSRVRKSTSEIPAECQELIESIQQCSRTELLHELSKINSWTFGKCELLHWAQVLDLFDKILGSAAERSEDNKWALKCDSFTGKDKLLLICILRFTSLLIEHSFSRHLYNSMEHLLVLLTSNEMNVVLEVLNLLYMFSKRSNFITRLKTEEKECLLERLQYLAENWGGKENGFGLADCCKEDNEIPSSATTLHVEFHREDSAKSPNKDNNDVNPKSSKPNLHIIHIEHIDKLEKTPAEIMKSLKSMYYIPAEKEMWLFTHVRLATNFATFEKRLKCVQARLQALSVLVYSNAIQDSTSNLLYNGILEELVEVVELNEPELTDIRCAALRTLTAIIHLDRNPQFPNRRPGARLNNIIDVTGASQYHGFLPVLVRNCIVSLTNDQQRRSKKRKHHDSSDEMTETSSDVESNIGVNAIQAISAHSEYKFPVSLTTALFSFLYHLASYDVGGEALVSCGMMESLLEVINWQGYELDHITFVTRAVRVIDLITNIDMQAFQVHGGLTSFINRLDKEVNFCNDDQLYQFPAHNLDDGIPVNEDNAPVVELEYAEHNTESTCLPQRAALLKSLLNFLKKAFQDATFAESIRHLMESPLPSALKNIIANAEYYGPSLFLLATDVVTVYVYQEPTVLPALQDNGLTNIVLNSLLMKEVPATREVLGSLPNVFSALCLNARGLELFARHRPFEKLFHILLSPLYLPAMRRRRSSEPTADTASNLGNAMDELMRHQPSLRQDATVAIVSLLEELVYLGSDPKYICWRPHGRAEPLTTTPGRAAPTEGSSDEEEEDEDETSTSSNAQTQNESNATQSAAGNERQLIPLIDYILNAMKFIDAILSNNSTDDHCREFVQKGGLRPLLRLLGLPNLPADCPVTNPAQSVATVCKSILNLAHEPYLFQEGLHQLSEVLDNLKPLCSPTNDTKPTMGGSKLLMELASAPDASAAFSSAQATPLLHSMNAAHGYVLMFVHVCRTGQPEIRNLSLHHWGKKEGSKVLKGLADLYTALVWESTLLLAYCSDDLIPSECDFTRESIEKLNQFFDRCETTQHVTEIPSNHSSGIDVGVVPMDIDGTEYSKSDSRNLKYIKPLLGASSRLGRALAELFGLLVKLCVGSPVRQRRGQNMITAPPVPSVHAKKVALALNQLLAKGLDCDSLPSCPTPKCRLTFLICSVGFTSPMLFDERRFPYYLMLKKFVSMGGQATFFKTFKWALGGDEGPSDVNALPEGTLGFLDAWLTLLEKMVNPKTILESPHVISTRPNATYRFDPIKYLIQIHRLAFDSIEKLWKHTPITSYGSRIADTILTILRHIYWGEKIIKEKLKPEDTRTTTTATTTDQPSTSNNGFVAVRDSEVNLRQLEDMGFSRENAIDALLHSSSVEQATDYLLSNPPQAARASTSAVDAETAEDDQVLQAIAMSLGDNSNAENPHATFEELQTLLDEFTTSALNMCLDLLNKMPDLVHKTCELLVTIMKRNGKEYRDTVLQAIAGHILKNAMDIYSATVKKCPGKTAFDAMVDTISCKRLANYTHLFILFYEVGFYYEMKLPFLALYGSETINLIIRLIKKAQHIIFRVFKNTRDIPEPKWLASSLLLVDAYLKVANRTDRKCKMHISTNRVWRWYDLVTGKWTHYSAANNLAINEAYWSGEQSVKITYNRKRYTITFPYMLQMNDETGNNRPIAMTLLSFTHPSCTDINEKVPKDTLFAELTEKEDLRCTPVPSMPRFEKRLILKSCVNMLHMPLERDLLHSILQICVRFTREFKMAKEFVREGGVKCLLSIRHIADFGGFGVLATILIRHALEEPDTLAYAMEKVIRGRTLTSIPPAYRDLVYLTRQFGAAVTRDPNMFFKVARNILRVDISACKPGDSLDVVLPIKSEPPVLYKAPDYDEPVSIQVICDLLDALLMPLFEKSSVGTKTSKKETKKPDNSAAGDSSLTANIAGPSSSNAATSNTDKNKDSSKTTEEEVIESKPMLPKSVVLKILADAVISYGPIAELITEHIYEAGCHSIIKKDTSALAFIFDKILPETENLSDSDCSSMCRILIAALASANHSAEAQLTLVNEVKCALYRAVHLPESSEKHSQIQHICGIISTMIDNCPVPPRGVPNASPVNNIIKILIRRGLFSDLAKISHFLDLSSPHISFTLNAALKPMESLSRSINMPNPNTTTVRGRRPSSGTREDPRTAAANPQHVQLEEDLENVEEGQAEATIERRDEDGDRDRLEEIMEQILEAETERAVPMDGGPLSFNPEADPTEEMISTDSGESDSNPSDDNDEDGNNDDDNGADANIEDNDGNNDGNNDGGRNNGERRNRAAELLEETPGLFRLGTNERGDEDVLMIHYDAEDANPWPRFIRYNDNRFSVPVLDENSGDQVIIHPLLLSRNTGDSNQNPVTRNQRTTRPRRYQYLFDTRNPNPPVILQRLLGTHDPHAMANMMTANNILAGPAEVTREQARVVIMDNFGIIPSNEEQIDFVDQSGYMFGPSLAATLNYVPPVVHWWNMESKILDMESVFDCTAWICNRLIPILIRHRNNELRVTQAEEEKTKKQKTKPVAGSEVSGQSGEFVVFNFDEQESGQNTPERSATPVVQIGAETQEEGEADASDSSDSVVVIGITPQLVTNYPTTPSSDGSSTRERENDDPQRPHAALPQRTTDDLDRDRTETDLEELIPQEVVQLSDASTVHAPYMHDDLDLELESMEVRRLSRIQQSARFTGAWAAQAANLLGNQSSSPDSDEIQSNSTREQENSSRESENLPREEENTPTEQEQSPRGIEEEMERDDKTLTAEDVESICSNVSDMNAAGLGREGAGERSSTEVRRIGTVPESTPYPYSPQDPDYSACEIYTGGENLSREQEQWPRGEQGMETETMENLEFMCSNINDLNAAALEGSSSGFTMNRDYATTTSERFSYLDMISSPPIWRGPTSPAQCSQTPTSPAVNPTSTRNRYRNMIASPAIRHGPTSPAHCSNAPSSPAVNPTSPTPRPSSPAFSPTSPSCGRPGAASYNIASPDYRASSPSYNITSPYRRASSPSYNIASPDYRAPSPCNNITSPERRASSPSYNITSADYRASSPSYNIASPDYRASSPSFSQTNSTTFRPTSPAEYNPTSPAEYSPTSPAECNPTSPAEGFPIIHTEYSPTSPAPCCLTSPGECCATKHTEYSPTSPLCSPSSSVECSQTSRVECSQTSSQSNATTASGNIDFVNILTSPNSPTDGNADFVPTAGSTHHYGSGNPDLGNLSEPRRSNPTSVISISSGSESSLILLGELFQNNAAEQNNAAVRANAPAQTNAPVQTNAAVQSDAAVLINAAGRITAAVQTNAVQINAAQTHAVQTNVVQTHAVQTNAVQTNPVQTNAVQRNAVQTSAVQTNASVHSNAAVQDNDELIIISDTNSETSDSSRLFESPTSFVSPGPQQDVYGDDFHLHLEYVANRRGFDRIHDEPSSSSSSSDVPSQEESRNGTQNPVVPGPPILIEDDETGEEVDNPEPQWSPGPSSAVDEEEIPDGVDPSFLEALPPEIRREVLEQQRIISLHQRLATTVTEDAPADPPAEAGESGERSSSSEASPVVSPEFLAALPPALQEEVLSQQRFDQQRQAAARAPPNEPVDAHAFFQTLQPSLRNLILADMEESQISALPPELAAEAQNLRRDWYARNRQIAQERFLQSNLPTIIRQNRGGRGGHRPISIQRGAWSQWGREFMASTAVRSPSTQVRIRGRQLVDHEGISCLLILLFTDDTHLNKLRLHRVIRNLCYHAPTREWIINALLSIIDKSVNTKPDESLNQPVRKVPRAGPLTSKLQTDSRHLNTGGHWLTIRMEAALGCAANVFLINKTSGKKAVGGHQAIGLHPQAAPVVCRNTLDLFTALAKAFPSCLLPIKLFRDDDLERNAVPPVKLNAPGQPDFWDILLKLDSAGSKKGKSIAKSTNFYSNSGEHDNLSFENTVFGRLLNMLGSPVVNRNTQLTDNLLKLLSVTTAGMPDVFKPYRPKTSKTKTEVMSAASIQALSLAVSVITYKNCSEEGLEFITTLLLNLASASQDMTHMILELLLDGAAEIGMKVEEEIQHMLEDLKQLISCTPKKKDDKDGPSTSKGVIYNRFTKEQVIIMASAKVKAACELQLPSMVPLTSKSSSQIFFLRVLRVIVQIRNSIKNNIKRNRLEADLVALSEQLRTLESLWETLSSCLLELEHAPDHHAVLVLQPAVEAFFLVHSPQQGAVSYKDFEKENATVNEVEAVVDVHQQSDGDAPAAGEAAASAHSNIAAAQSIVTALAGAVLSRAGTSSSQDDSTFSSSSTTLAGRQVSPEQQKFLAFAEKHRTVLNQILRQSTAHLADGPFAVLVDHTRILDFDIKRRYFRTELERMDHGIRREETAVHVRRLHVFEDSFRELFRRTPEEWKNRFYIVFEEEEGQDAGGLLREWYVIISRDIFNPMYALFTVSPGDRVTYMINSASHYNSNHLCYYKFVGRVIAKAIYDNKLLECYFTRSFYKHILGIPVKYTDMESEDYTFYRGLIYLMENNIKNLGLDLMFSTEISEFGVTETRDLIPNGRHIPVLEENKMDYIRLVCQMKMTGEIKQQLTAFLEGFYDIIPMRLISIFNEQELELLISGLPNVDIDDLKANTEYHKYQSNSLQIQWFWRALRSFDQADRAKFLQFVTGTSKVPLQGFGALEGMNGVQKFQIHRDDRSTDRLPSAHTCFNQLDLPVYETYDKLRAYLLKAIHECSEGFGFA